MEKFTFSRVILGSASPRRKSLLETIGLSFEVIRTDIEEVYPNALKGHEITDYLASQKAESLEKYLDPGTLILTADTIVWFNGSVMDKPANPDQARQTLKALSGHWHEVITSVCFTTANTQILKFSSTRVKFARLTDEMIQSYISSGEAMDKAGAYGIQEWIGLVGVERIEGSYTNVVGLPTQLVYKTLRDMARTSD
jgi:septum formation protein